MRCLSWLLFLACGIPVIGQTNYYFPLSNDLQDLSGIQALTILPNLSGEDGNFETRYLGGTAMPGWAFEKNVGLQFDNNGWIGNTWTFSFYYEVDVMNLFSAPYIRLWSFQHYFDHGIFINPLNFFGLVEERLCYYPPPAGSDCQSIGTTGSISTGTIYHFVFSRDASGGISVYQDCNLVAYFNDPGGHHVPLASDDRLVLFRDTTDVNGNYDGEAEPGWVSQLRISNQVWDTTMINTACTNLPSILDKPILDLTASKQGSFEGVELRWNGRNIDGGFQDFRIIRYAPNGDKETIFSLVDKTVTHVIDRPQNKGMYVYQAIAIDRNGVLYASNLQYVDWQPQRISLYPNPARDILNIRGLSLEEEIQIVWYDRVGRQITTQFTSGRRPWLKIAAMPNGLYQVRIMRQGQFLGQYPVVIAR